jgi:urease accessory protein
MMTISRLPALLHLCDSLFPTGGYAHSDGLEAATASLAVADGPALRAWLDTLVRVALAHSEGPAVRLGWEGFTDRRWADLRMLDDELYAQRPCSTSREAGRGTGSRLIRTWAQLYPHPGLDVMLTGEVAGPWLLPIAFAAATASIGVDLRATIEAFAYTRLVAAISSAMRLMPLGQLEAHAIAAEALTAVPSLCESVLRSGERPGGFMPLADLASMQQQYVTSRLFRS